MVLWYLYACPVLQSIVMAGVFSAIPYTLLALMVVVSGQLADFMRKYISTTYK